MKRKFIGTYARVMMSCLSLDLLYLYYAGAWVEPIKFILISELILLYAISVLGIVWAISYLRR